MKYFFFFSLCWTHFAYADVELGASQSLMRIYSIDGVSPPAKLRSNVGFGINLASDVKYSENNFFIYGITGKILHFNSPIEAKLTNNFSSINEFFLGLKKIKEDSIYQFKIGPENFLYYRFNNNQYQIIRATPIMANFKVEKQLKSLKELKYTMGFKTYLPFADTRDSGKVGFGGALRFTYDMEDNQAKCSPYLEAEYAIKKIKQTTFSRLDISVGFTITIDIREKKSKLF